jgi:hypothetical protein
LLILNHMLGPGHFFGPGPLLIPDHVLCHGPYATPPPPSVDHRGRYRCSSRTTARSPPAFLAS